MRILLLGHGKTGSLVEEIALQRGHSVRVLSARENTNAAALTPPYLTLYDVVIDFTTPDAVLQNLRACLANSARVVVGTTGWYSQLDDLRSLAERKQAALLYGTNFSFGVQLLYRLAALLSKEAHGYEFKISETHHATKKDAPSGTALTLQSILEKSTGVQSPIASHREGDSAGLHSIQATSANDRLVLEHEAFSRRGFAEGAVRAAEWLSTRTGVYDFSEIFDQIQSA